MSLCVCVCVCVCLCVLHCALYCIYRLWSQHTPNNGYRHGTAVVCQYSMPSVTTKVAARVQKFKPGGSVVQQHAVRAHAPHVQLDPSAVPHVRGGNKSGFCCCQPHAYCIGHCHLRWFWVGSPVWLSNILTWHTHTHTQTGWRERGQSWKVSEGWEGRWGGRERETVKFIYYKYINN